MSPLRLAQIVRLRTNTNSTTFTNADMLVYANVAKDDITTEIVKADEDYFGAPQTANLVEDQREYPLPSDLLNHIKQVEAKLDGTNWITLKQFDLVDRPIPTDEESITSRFSNEQDRAYFDVYRNSLWIYSGSISEVVNGLKLWGYVWPADITDLTSEVDMSIDPSSTSPGFPRPFHELLARRIVIDWKTSKDRGVALTESELKYAVDLQDKVDFITGMDKQGATTGDLPDTVSRDYDNGFNL